MAEKALPVTPRIAWEQFETVLNVSLFGEDKKSFVRALYRIRVIASKIYVSEQTKRRSDPREERRALVYISPFCEFRSLSCKRRDAMSIVLNDPLGQLADRLVEIAFINSPRKGRVRLAKSFGTSSRLVTWIRRIR